MDLQALRQKCLEQARESVSSSVSDDDFIAQAITNIEELEKTCNSLMMRIREWYNLNLPELSRQVRDNEVFVKRIKGFDKKALMKELEISVSAGADLKVEDLEPIKEYASSVEQLYELKEKITAYLEKVMDKRCKNLKAVAGSTIGARLLADSGGLQRMSEMTSTSIQLLGAEKALFRHLKTGANPPRHGHIFAHPLIQKAKEKDRGRVARALANKIAIAVRTDYFGKDFIGASLREELEKRFS